MRRYRCTILCSGILLGLSFLAGCVNFKRSFPEKRRFSLDVAREGTARHAGSKAVLRVCRFDVSPRYEARALAYRTNELSYESDYYNEFVISPGLLITEEVRQWLAGAVAVL